MNCDRTLARSTARDLKRVLELHGDTFPADFRRSAELAVRTLEGIDRSNFAACETLQRITERELRAFLGAGEAYC